MDLFSLSECIEKVANKYDKLLFINYHWMHINNSRTRIQHLNQINSVNGNGVPFISLNDKTRGDGPNNGYPIKTIPQLSTNSKFRCIQIASAVQRAPIVVCWG